MSKAISDETRVLILKLDQEGLSTKEISEQTGLSKGTVLVSFSVGRYLADYGYLIGSRETKSFEEYFCCYFCHRHRIE